MIQNSSIDIVGAGIGGMTTAIALQQEGISSRIFEKAEKLESVGAGIILANNAMQVYNKLGLKEKIEACGNPISSIKITDSKLNPISEVDLSYFEELHHVRNIAIHRGKLQEILSQQIDPNCLHLNHALESISKEGAGYVVKFRDGSSINSKVLIGADGINSTVRKYLFPESLIRRTNQICWRGIADMKLTDKYVHELNEAWGKGDRFGFVQIGPHQVYWYALKSIRRSFNEYSKDDLALYFRSYHTIIRELIDQTPLEGVHTSEICDLYPLKNWFKENICLLGDAAHATTPNMGQGACQAIEDAYVLAQCLKQTSGQDTYLHFQALRRPKALQVVKTSWTLGNIAHWENPLAIQLRNVLFKIMPQKINQQQMSKIFEITLG